MFKPVQEKCIVCTKTVYPTEKMVVESGPMHQSCFRCAHCNRQLTLSNFASVNNTLYCKVHYIALFKQSGGKYDVFGAYGDKDNKNASQQRKESVSSATSSGNPAKGKDADEEVLDTSGIHLDPKKLSAFLAQETKTSKQSENTTATSSPKAPSTPTSSNEGGRLQELLKKDQEKKQQANANASDDASSNGNNIYANVLKNNKNKTAAPVADNVKEQAGSNAIVQDTSSPASGRSGLVKERLSIFQNMSKSSSSSLSSSPSVSKDAPAIAATSSLNTSLSPLDISRSSSDGASSLNESGLDNSFSSNNSSLSVKERKLRYLAATKSSTEINKEFPKRIPTPVAPKSFFVDDDDESNENTSSSAATTKDHTAVVTKSLAERQQEYLAQAQAKKEVKSSTPQIKSLSEETPNASESTATTAASTDNATNDETSQTVSTSDSKEPSVEETNVEETNDENGDDGTEKDIVKVPSISETTITELSESTDEKPNDESSQDANVEKTDENNQENGGEDDDDELLQKSFEKPTGVLKKTGSFHNPNKERKLIVKFSNENLVRMRSSEDDYEDENGEEVEEQQEQQEDIENGEGNNNEENDHNEDEEVETFKEGDEVKTD